jgi:predicted HicB family RNase H-like nuclease
MPAGQRSTAGRHAQRVNAAVRMLASGLSVVEAARLLARRHGVSQRQARRYAEQARNSGSAQVPKAKMVFTVKIPVDLVKRLKRYAASGGASLSSLVTQALEEFFSRISGRQGGGG